MVFDIESTGLNARTDRILELAAIKVHPNGARERRTWLINPGIPIPLESIAVHGITDDEVRDCPSFSDVADEIAGFLRGCDLGGFGMSRLDIPMLEEEFARCGRFFRLSDSRLFDAQRIYHKKEPRDLAAALRFYCGKDLVDAHGAEADAEATLEVLEGEFQRYSDLPTDPDQLDAMLNERDPFNLDHDGKLRWLDGEITINFGKMKGAKLRDLIRDNPNFVKWMLRGDFPRDTKDVIKRAVNGEWPSPPPQTPSAGHVELANL